MKRNRFAGLLIAALCMLLIAPSALSETREGVIYLEGMEETIEETLFESPLGFSFWYASDVLEAYHGEADNIEGVVVASLYTDDYMVLSMISPEDAEEYTEDYDESIVEQSAASRVQMDLYRELENGRYYFLTLIAENGRYFRAVGEYSQESSDGNAKYLQRVLDSVAFTPGYPLRAEWGEWEADDEGSAAQVILTALEPLTDVKLLRLDWEGFTVSWEEDTPLFSLAAGQSVSVTLEFIGDFPNNGVAYTDEGGIVHAYALDLSGEDGELYFWPLDE